MCFKIIVGIIILIAKLKESNITYIGWAPLLSATTMQSMVRRRRLQHVP